MRVAQYIAKEESWFAARLFVSSLDSLADCVNKIVIVDNGCSELCRTMYREALDRYTKRGVDSEVKVVDGWKNFAELRNISLSMSKPGDLICMADCDEVHYPEGVKKILETMESNQEIGEVVTQFIHHRRDPWMYQALMPKVRFYRQGPDTRWESTVHEALRGVAGKTATMQYVYHHFGYCKSRSELLFHWINYDLLEYGEVKRYDIRSVDSVDPNKDMHGQFRPSENQQYCGRFPPSVEWMFDDTMKKHGLRWTERGLEGQSFDPLKDFINAQKSNLQKS